MMTLEEAKRVVADGREAGVSCPCCEQDCKVYPRKLNSAMAEWLVWLVGEYEHAVENDEALWIDIRRFPVRGGDYAKLIHWQLVEQRPKDPSDTVRRTSGHWRPTPRGIDFAYARTRVPSHALLFNNTFEGFVETTTDIREAFGKRFSFVELMRTIVSRSSGAGAADLLRRIAGEGLSSPVTASTTPSAADLLQKLREGQNASP